MVRSVLKMRLPSFGKIWLVLLLTTTFMVFGVQAQIFGIRDTIPCPFENQDNYPQMEDTAKFPSSFAELCIIDTSSELKILLQDGVSIGCGLGLQAPRTITYYAWSRANPEVSHPWMYVQAALMHDTLVDHLEDSAPVNEGNNVISVRSEDTYTVPSGIYYVIGCHKGKFPSGNEYHTHTQSGTLFVS